MKKVSFLKALEIIYNHNKEKNITIQYEDKKPLQLVIVYDLDNFDKWYSEKERSYKVRSDEKYFLPEMMGNSLFGDCLDGYDVGVRLDWYNWKISYCYFLED